MIGSAIRARRSAARRATTSFLAALSALVLAVPALAAVVVTSAGPAGAVPVTLRVTGDAASRNTIAPGVLTWEGGDFS